MADSDNSKRVTDPIQTGFMFRIDCRALSPEQSNHVTDIAKEFALEMGKKYVKGQIEHGGNLWDLSEDRLIDAAIDEAIDQVVYLLTIRLKRRATNGS